MSTPSPSPTSHHEPHPRYLPSDVEKKNKNKNDPFFFTFILSYFLENLASCQTAFRTGRYIVATMEVLHSRSSVRKTPPHKEDAIIFNDLQSKENFLKQAFHRSKFQQLLPERTFVSGFSLRKLSLTRLNLHCSEEFS
jgi:hypothetical protein